jgi:drug/metabolite transporter (DMT)-like permease
MKPEYLGILIAALSWGFYPLIARWAGVGGAIGSLILSVTGLVTIGAAVAIQGVDVRPTMTATLRMVMAGVLMGIGLIAFNYVAASRRIDASVSIPIMDTAMMMVTTIAAIWLFNEPVTVKKVVGLALLQAGIYVLRPTEA